MIIISAPYWVFNLFMKENKAKIDKRWWFVFIHGKIIGERTEEIVKKKWTVLSQRVGPTGRIRSEGRGRAVTKGGTQGIRAEKIEPETGDRG